MKLMKEKAEQLLQRCEVVVITSVNEEGYPVSYTHLRAHET